ncbi:MAG: acyl-CoA dehydrogenase [Acidimicrobiales bacterium]|nr:acyl-CoA dehydrogenase [Acidimicrobiales bacterium]
MDLGMSADQEAIKEVFASFFIEQTGPESARNSIPLGFDAKAWNRISETGAPGMGVSPPAGGGASLSDLVIVAEEAGSQIAPLPIIDHVVTSRVLEKLDLMEEEVLAGTLIAGLVVRPVENDVAKSVPTGAIANRLIALNEDKLLLLTDEPPNDSLPNHGDLPIAHRVIRNADIIAEGVEATELFDRALNEWKTLISAFLVGITRSSIEITVEYVKDRNQFGKPIGSFQSVQHGLADLPGLCDGARLLVNKAAWAGDKEIAGAINLTDNEISDFATLASMSLVFAGETSIHATDRGLHYHGGYGFSEEYDIQLFYRRARAWSQILNSPSEECLNLADLLLKDSGAE